MSQAIKISYSSVDGHRATKSFKTLKGARAFAVKMIGQSPEISEMFRYAVSADGIGKITVDGVTLSDLFKSEAAPKLKGAARFDKDSGDCMNCIEGEFDGEVTYPGRVCDECKAEHATWMKQDAERKAAFNAASAATRDPSDILF